ncbi:hypothetical protein HHL16_14640 [Pseudoflavitalea sp. G-6-1-2]|uniref:DUF7003 family protein n=1 Tax=Pseudoflavitalea sp. G-6-1-2 TaxID=2728841 RepID=UPI00146D2F1D|nr:hypothetical protein [Pseudoflavitalea sp. G-6-1-2]NML22118.1 hypothetical protein [Pseudoflavitalea sp. G-6-1-2]
MSHNNSREAYTAKDILEQLDQSAANFEFPMLDNAYVYPVTNRLSAYRDESRWMIIIETVGFNYRGGGHNGINNCLYVYGNELTYKPGLNNNNFLNFTADSTSGPTFDTNAEEFLNPYVNSMLLRDREISISSDPQFYAAQGIRSEGAGRVTIWELLRGLEPEHRNDFFATSTELKERVPQDLPLFLRLEEWHHPDLANEERPGKNETFVMLADALETGDLSIFKPKTSPNTHWSNWPEGGTL